MKKRLGCSYEKIPPLYRYAEALNGELIKVPVCLMNGANVQLLKDQRNGKGVDPDKPKAFSGSMDNAVLFHYLLHRIAISRARNRGNFIQFDTIHKMVEPYLAQSSKKDTRMLKRKVLSIMCHYAKMKYVLSGGYIKNFPYTLEHAEQTISFSRIGIFVIGKMAGSNSITKGLLQKDTYKNQGYILSKNTMNAIRENEKNYDNYDGIVLFRNDEALVQRIINNRPFG